MLYQLPCHIRNRSRSVTELYALSCSTRYSALSVTVLDPCTSFENSSATNIETTEFYHHIMSLCEIHCTLSVSAVYPLSHSIRYLALSVTLLNLLSLSIWYRFSSVIYPIPRSIHYHALSITVLFPFSYPIRYNALFLTVFFPCTMTPKLWRRNSVISLSFFLTVLKEDTYYRYVRS